VLEDNDQLGLAHMVEHMSFNGTAHFEKQQIVNFMESIGMRFGPSLDACTSFDETIYMLTIPVAKLEVMDKAFPVLEYRAQNLTFDPNEIDKERGVIVEEWRPGRGANARMQDKYFPILFQGARYVDRRAWPCSASDKMKYVAYDVCASTRVKLSTGTAHPHAAFRHTPALLQPVDTRHIPLPYRNPQVIAKSPFEPQRPRRP
jgi:hypothetical protein